MTSKERKRIMDELHPIWKQMAEKGKELGISIDCSVIIHPEDDCFKIVKFEMLMLGRTVIPGPVTYREAKKSPTLS